MTQDGEKMTELSRSRKWHHWTYDDHRKMVELIRAGLSDEDIAHELGRTMASVRARSDYFLPDSGATSSGQDDENDTLEQLRTTLHDDPEYDWLVCVRATYRSNASHLWIPSEDKLLHESWDAGTPGLPELANRLDLTEFQLARRLVQLGIADSSIDVVEKLGCQPGGYLQSLVRVARDRRALNMWVLTCTQGDVTHVSLHITEDDALTRRDALLSEPFKGLQDRTWTISDRVVGQLERGKHLSGVQRNPDRPEVDIDFASIWSS